MLSSVGGNTFFNGLSSRWRGLGIRRICVIVIIPLVLTVLIYINVIDGGKSVRFKQLPDQLANEKKIHEHTGTNRNSPNRKNYSAPRVKNTGGHDKKLHGPTPGVKNTGNHAKNKATKQGDTDQIYPSLRLYLEEASRTIVNDTQHQTAPTCSHSLGPTPVDDLAKIESYKFKGIQQYLDDLFPPMITEPVLPEVPVFVTAFSSNHYHEGLSLFKDIQEIVRPKYNNLKVIFYDIGLSKQQLQKLNTSCSCEVRRFQFDRYPGHVRNLQNYAWKTIIIQLVAKEHPFVSWMDASVRWKTSDLDDLFAAARKNWIMADDDGPLTYGTIPERTLKQTFESLHEDPCTFASHGEKHATYIFLVANQFTTKYFLRPWVSCALTFGCMEPVKGSSRYLPCPPNQNPFTYHLCHRFDQSMLGILYVRLFHRSFKQHAIDRKYFMFCGATVKTKQVCTFFDA